MDYALGYYCLCVCQNRVVWVLSVARGARALCSAAAAGALLLAALRRCACNGPSVEYIIAPAALITNHRVQQQD